MQIFRSILHLLGRPNVPTLPAHMNRLSSSSRPVLSLMASATPRWWPSALARRVFLFVAASNPPDRIVSQFPLGSRNITTVSRVQVDKSGKPYGRLPISPSGKVITISQDNDHYAIDQGNENIMTDNSKKLENTGTRGTISEAIYEDDRSDKDASRTTSVVIDGKGYTWGQNVDITGCDEDRRSAANDLMVEIVVSEEEGYAVNDILAQSRHRDGSIYRGMDLSWWKKEYRIADRNETRLEPMTLSDPANCIIRDGTCMTHDPCSMLQFFSVELAKIPLDGGLVELYGYIAVRDDLDPLLNYIVNISRDDPIIVEQGSLINMTGPKRGIDIVDSALIEYDMKIKTGEQEKDDIQLIDGASLLGAEGTWDQPFIFRIPGDGGAVDLTLSCLLYAVEATVEVLISEVQSSFNLSLECLTSGFDEEIQLFDGTVAESCGLKRSVLAVLKNSVVDLKFKVGALSSSPDQHCRSFNAKTHGHDTQEIKTDFASISVKVTWSTLPGGSLSA